jgi:signal transduction histidine kinase
MGSRGESRYPRLALAYLVAIVLATVVFLSLLVMTWYRQSQEIEQLSESNLQLWGQKLALELEARIWDAAEACLADEALQQVPPEGAGTLEWYRTVDSLISPLQKRHPVVHTFFVLENGVLRYPSSNPVSQLLASEPARQVEPNEAGRAALSTPSLGTFSALAHSQADSIAAPEVLDERAQREFTSTLRRRFTPRNLPRGQVGAEFIRQGNQAYQVFYRQSLMKPGRIIGFGMHEPWVKEELLPYSIQVAGSKESFPADLRQISEPVSYTSEHQESPDIVVSLKTLLPLSELRIPRSVLDERRAKAYAERAGLLVSMSLFLCVLGFGGYLIVRTTRELQVREFRSDFFSAFSHDLKTPLTLIRLYGETLSHAEDLSEGDRRTYSRIITRESHRLGHLIEQTLDFAKIEKGGKKYLLREGNLAGLLEGVIADYADHLRQSGFHVNITWAASLPLARFDSDAVSQAVINLLDNATKYSPDEKFIGVHLWQRGTEVILEVEDHGQGIPFREQKKIFRPFYRVNDNGKNGGYGLGLYLVRHVMEGHGGRVELVSTLGKGSRFLLVFPGVEGTEQETRPSRREEEDKVLV